MDPLSAIRDLLVIRDDTYAKQGVNGYIRLDEPLTDDVLQKHLDGEITVGTYQFNTSNICKWVCFDFDGESDLPGQFQRAKLLYLKLRDDLRIPSVLLEFSGRKGYHVWVFCNEVDGASAKVWAEDVSKDYGVHEIFPKQASIGDRFGNLVKLPLCIHRVTGKRSTFFDDSFNELTFDDSMALLTSVAARERVTIPKVIIREIIRTVRVGGAKTELPQFIQNLIREGVAEGGRHKHRFIIAKEMFNAGYSPEEIVQAILVFNRNCSPPDNAFIAERHARKLLEYPARYLAREVVNDAITPAELQAMGDISYRTVIDTYNKWMCLGDTSMLDMALAVAITRKEPVIPLWIIMIAPSGSGKSEIIRPFEDKESPPTTEIMSKITKNTFLSGVKDEPDFAHTLHKNPRLFLTFDFAQFIKLNSEEKAQIWAQLRDLYDGFIERKAAFNVRKKVTDIKVNWLICSTPVVDSELLIQQELGTRELLFRFDYDDTSDQELMERVWANSDRLHQMRQELGFIVRKFIEKKETEGLQPVTISDDTRQELMNTAVTIAALRAATESDHYTGELTNFVYKEMPTRILLQLKAIYIGLRNLDESYTDEKALQVIQRVALSSIHPIRLKIILALMRQETMSTTEIQKTLNIGWKTVITQLYTARQLGLVDYSEDAYTTEGEGAKTWKRKSWFLTDNRIVDFLKEKHNVRKQAGAIYAD